MTKRDIIDAYVRGDVDRRGFIRKLSAMGVSAAAAAAYAGSFGQDAAAAPARNSAGYVARLQDADDDYGIAVAIENIIQALQEFTDRMESLILRLGEVVNRGNGPRPEVLQKVLDQVTEQREALLARLQQRLDETGQASTTVNGLSSARLQGDATLEGIANDFNVQTGLLAAIIPAIQNDADRQLMTNIGLVTARHAALINDFADLDLVPSAFETPIAPESVS